MKIHLQRAIVVIFLSILPLIHVEPVSAYILHCPPWCARGNSINTYGNSVNTSGNSVNTPGHSVNTHGRTVELAVLHGKNIYRIEIRVAQSSEIRKSAKPALPGKHSKLFGSNLSNPFDTGAAAFMILTCSEIAGCCHDEAGSYCPCGAREIDGKDILFYYSQVVSIDGAKGVRSGCYLVERIETGKISLIMDEKRFEKVCRETARTQRNRVLVDNGLRLELVPGSNGRVGMKVGGINLLTAAGAIAGEVSAAIEDLSPIVQFAKKSDDAPVRYHKWPWPRLLPCPGRQPEPKAESR
jgi:hypothetical protein